MAGKSNYNNIGLWPSGLRVDIKLLSNSVANCYIVNHHNYFKTFTCISAFVYVASQYKCKFLNFFA